MKPIKCPNCGKNMYRGISGLFGKMWASRMCCPSCGVEGPRGTAPTSDGSVRIAARLTREWIARMENRTKLVVYSERNKGVRAGALMVIADIGRRAPNTALVEELRRDYNVDVEFVEVTP